MTVFCRKNLQASMGVGERLKKAREDKSLDLAAVSAQTRIPIKYLEAIEAGNFCGLPPAKAHRLAYIRAYADALEENPADYIRQFARESNLESYRPVHPLQKLKIKAINSYSFIFKKIAIAVFVLGFLAYLAWQVNGILRPPKLTVYTPVDGYVSGRLATLVQGETENEVTLTVNGKEIMANGKGQFEAEVDLSNGINTITISAIKKHGKTTTVTRHVVVKPDATVQKVGMDNPLASP